MRNTNHRPTPPELERLHRTNLDLTAIVRAPDLASAQTIMREAIAKTPDHEMTSFLAHELGRITGLLREYARVDDAGNLEIGMPLERYEHHSMRMALHLLDGVGDIPAEVSKLAIIDQTKVAIRAAQYLAGCVTAQRTSTGASKAEIHFREQMSFGIEASESIARLHDESFTL